MSDALKELRDIALDRLESENRSLTGVNFSAGDVWKDEHNGCWIANIEEVGTGNNHVAAQAVSRDIDEVERRRDVMLAALIRLAPPAPVEASGSEDMRRREITAVMTALDSFAVLAGRVTATQAEHVLASLAALRPQPSGETQERARSVERVKGWLDRNPEGGAEPIHPDDLRALIRPAPVASGGQHSSAPDEPTEAMIQAGLKVDFDNEDERATIINLWQTMKAAAPVAETAGERFAYVSLDRGSYPDDLIDHLNGFITGGSGRCREALEARGVVIATVPAQDGDQPSAFVVWNEGRSEGVIFTDLDREPGEPTAQDDAATASLGDHGSISSVLAGAFYEAFEDDNERPIERIALSTIRGDG